MLTYTLLKVYYPFLILDFWEAKVTKKKKL